MRENEPRAVLGEDLWQALAALDDPPLPDSFDAGFQARLRRSRFRVHGRTRLLLVSTTAVLTAAAAALLLFRTPVPSDDLALVADLDLLENIELLEDLDVVMAWDGEEP